MNPRVLVSMAFAFASAISPASWAATITPTRFDDPIPDSCLPRDCSLREAVIAANARPGKDTIVLVPGEYVLTAGGSGADTPAFADLDVTDALHLMGSDGATVTRIVNRVAPVPDSVESRVLDVADVPFKLTGVTLGGGRLRSADGRGGCLRIQGSGSQVLRDVQVVGCEAAVGGGIYAWRLDLDHVVVRDSRATRGGGIALKPAGTTRFLAASIEANEAAEVGGGLYLEDGFMNSVAIELDGASAFVGNTAPHGGGIATGGDGHGNFVSVRIIGPAQGLALIEANTAVVGGGIWGNATWSEFSGLRIRGNRAAYGGGFAGRGTFTLRDSELGSNEATDNGGGLHAVNAAVRVSRSAFNGNLARFGGAIHATGGYLLQIENVSVHGNTADGGGGFFLDAVGADSRLLNVSMLDNEALSGDGSDALLLNNASLAVAASWLHDGCRFSGALLQSQGGNAQGSGTSPCGFGPSDLGYVGLPDTAAQVGTWDGRFDVIGFEPGLSILENAAGVAPCAASDVRSLLRVDGLCDIGAFEATGEPAFGRNGISPMRAPDR